MGWFGWGEKCGAVQQDDVDALQRAQDAMGVLFHNKPIGRNVPQQIKEPLVVPPPPLRVEAANGVVNKTVSSNRTSRSAAATPVEGDTAVALDWRRLPPSPISGYQLGVDGLYDTMRSGGGHGAGLGAPLTASELRRLIRETSALEASAKYVVDATMPQHVAVKSSASFEYLLSTALGCCGAFVLVVNAPRNYMRSVPRDSLLFSSRGLSWLAGIDRWSEVRCEAFARKYGWLLRCTAGRVAGSVAAGLSLLGVAAVTSFPYDTVASNAFATLGRDQVSYHVHTKVAAQWLWTVYFHHPAYRDVSTSCVPFDVSPRGNGAPKV